MMKKILAAHEVAELPKSSIVALWNDMADGDNPPVSAKSVSKDQAPDLGQRTHARAAELGYCVLETDGGIELAVADEVGPTDSTDPTTLTEEEVTETQAALDAEPIDPHEDNEPLDLGMPDSEARQLLGEEALTAPQPGAAAFLASQGVAPAAPDSKPAKAKRGFAPSPDDQRRIKLLQPLNPKRGKSALRYAQYVDGMTIAEYIAACVSKQLVKSGTHCRADIEWDVKRKYIEVLPASTPAA